MKIKTNGFENKELHSFIYSFTILIISTQPEVLFLSLVPLSSSYFTIEKLLDKKVSRSWLPSFYYFYTLTTFQSWIHNFWQTWYLGKTEEDINQCEQTNTLKTLNWTPTLLHAAFRQTNQTDETKQSKTQRQGRAVMVSPDHREIITEQTTLKHGMNTEHIIQSYFTQFTYIHCSSNNNNNSNDRNSSSDHKTACFTIVLCYCENAPGAGCTTVNILTNMISMGTHSTRRCLVLS